MLLPVFQKSDIVRTCLKSKELLDFKQVLRNYHISRVDTVSKHEEHPFYGENIFRHQEQSYIQNLLKKYKKEPVTDELKKKIWNELQTEKHLGRIKIPFKVVIRKDPYKKFPDYIEVILDTKV